MPTAWSSGKIPSIQANTALEERHSLTTIHPSQQPLGSQVPGSPSRTYTTTSVCRLSVFLPSTCASSRATDARVGLPAHQGSPGAPLPAHTSPEEAKRGHPSHVGSTSNFPTRVTPKKRALQRAITRASRNADLHTWYRGRRVHLRSLCPGHAHQTGHLSHSRTEGTDASELPAGMPAVSTQSPTKRYCSGCSRRSRRTDQLMSCALSRQHGARTQNSRLGRTWTRTPRPGGMRSTLVLKRSWGPMPCPHLLLWKLDDIRYSVIQAGRLPHVRLLLQVPLDILCVYQIAWNHSKASLEQSRKADQLVQQREKLWRKMSQWTSQIPLRHGLLLLGDFNTPATA